jgi:hypothetical protein
MASNKSSDQDELNDSVSKADIDKMIRFLHAHTDSPNKECPFNALLSKKLELLTGGQGGSLVELKVKPSVLSLTSFGVLCLGSGSLTTL